MHLSTCFDKYFFYFLMKWQKRNNIVFAVCSFDLHTYYTHCIDGSDIVRTRTRFAGNIQVLWYNKMQNYLASMVAWLAPNSRIDCIWHWLLDELKHAITFFLFFFFIVCCSFFNVLDRICENFEITNRILLKNEWNKNRKNKEHRRTKKKNHRTMIKLFARHTGG